MIFSFRSAGLLVAVLILGCTRPEAEKAGEDTPGRAGEVLGMLKLVRQEYVNAVDPQGDRIVDEVEYAEAELFAEQAEVKFADWAAAVADAPRRDQITQALARLRKEVARKAPHADVLAVADEGIGAVEPLLAGAVPEQIRGTVLATTRADRALIAEDIVGEYRIGLTSGPARRILRRDGKALVALPDAPPSAVYVGVLLRERRTKRFLPSAAVTVVIDGNGSRSETPLTELWGEFHQYGANVVLPEDGPVTIDVRVSPPAYARHGDMLTHFVQPVSTTLKALVRNEALAFDALPVRPVDTDYSVGDDVLQALAEAGSVHEAGPYRVGVIVEGPEPIWTWENGTPTLKPIPGDATNHLEVVLLDPETGQLVPNAHVDVTFLSDGRAVGTAMLHPLLSIFSHYGATLALPPGATAVRVHVDAPALGALDRPRLADAAEIEVALPSPKKKPA